MLKYNTRIQCYELECDLCHNVEVMLTGRRKREKYCKNCSQELHKQHVKDYHNKIKLKEKLQDGTV